MRTHLPFLATPRDARAAVKGAFAAADLQISFLGQQRELRFLPALSTALSYVCEAGTVIEVREVAAISGSRYKIPIVSHR